jgi:HEAT repeat protein
LLKGYHTYDPDVRFVAIRLFGERRFRPAIGLLFRELNSDDPALSGAAGVAIGQIGGERAYSRLKREWERCANTRRRRTLLSSIGSFCGRTEVSSQIEILMAVLRDSDEDAELRAIAAEGAIRLLLDVDRRLTTYRRAISLIIEMLSDPTPLVRFSCVHALGELRVHAACAKLTDLSTSDRSRIPGIGTVAEEAQTVLRRLAGE